MASRFVRLVSIFAVRVSAIAATAAVAGSGLSPSLVGRALAASAPAPADFRFAIIGDRTGANAPEIYEKVIRDIELLHPAFVLSVGDQIEGYTEDPAKIEAQWDEFHELLGGFTVPFHYCPGNHDITTDAMLEPYRRATGTDPCYSFDHQGAHFIILDTSRWETSQDWIEKSGYADWLRHDLESNRSARLTVVVYHKPYWFNTLAAGTSDPMHRIFQDHGVDAVFNGHFHVYGAAEYDGIRYTIIGSSGGGIGQEDEALGRFFHFAWCAVRGDSLDWRVIRRDGLLDRDEITIADQMRIEGIERELVRPDRFVDPRWDPSAESTLHYSLRNPLAEPWTYELRWDPAPGWSIQPDRATLTLNGGAAASLPFAVARTGAFYPLPTLRVAVPYRAGRSYDYSASLPALRAQGARRPAQAPVIDGRLEDPCWNAATPATEFGTPDGGADQIEPTAFFFLYDTERLYLAARCTQRESPFTLQTQGRDGEVFRDDCVGYFLCADTSGAVAHQIYWNADGVLFDQKLSETTPGYYAGDRTWNLSCRAVASRNDEGWILEAAIPFDSLGAPPRPGDTWRVNFRRKEIGKGSSADWQVPIDYNPERYGLLVFQ